MFNIGYLPRSLSHHYQWGRNWWILAESKEKDSTQKVINNFINIFYALFQFILHSFFKKKSICNNLPGYDAYSCLRKAQIRESLRQLPCLLPFHYYHMDKKSIEDSGQRFCQTLEELNSNSRHIFFPLWLLIKYIQYIIIYIL